MHLVYSVYSLIVLIMASKESNTIYETLPESEILTESELDELSEIPTDTIYNTRSAHCN